MRALIREAVSTVGDAFHASVFLIVCPKEYRHRKSWRAAFLAHRAFRKAFDDAGFASKFPPAS